ncbi:MAG: helix-turn-helix transcriptional regulator [Coriobacteriales bacterium]|nr:helix-turn-helix transcriptional regulator [Coriobacteriales bacterium]
MRKVSAAAVEPVPQQGQAGGTGYRAKFKEACEQIIAEYDLTKREGEVFVLLAKGRTTDAIAERLVISPATAQTHVKNIYHKLGVRSHQVLMDMVEERAEEALKQQG